MTRDPWWFVFTPHRWAVRAHIAMYCDNSALLRYDRAVRTWDKDMLKLLMHDSLQHSRVDKAAQRTMLRRIMHHLTHDPEPVVREYG